MKIYMCKINYFLDSILSNLFFRIVVWSVRSRFRDTLVLAGAIQPKSSKMLQSIFHYIQLYMHLVKNIHSHMNTYVYIRHILNL